MESIIIFLVVVFLGVASGLVISRMAKDELVQGRKYFRVLIIGGILGAIWFYFTKDTVISATFIFIGVLAAVSLAKSAERKIPVRR